jgi:hypothetical protein
MISACSSRLSRLIWRMISATANSFRAARSARAAHTDWLDFNSACQIANFLRKGLAAVASQR